MSNKNTGKNAGSSRLLKYVVPILVVIYVLASMLTGRQGTGGSSVSESTAAGTQAGIETEAAAETTAVPDTEGSSEAAGTSEAYSETQASEPETADVSAGTSDHEYSEVNGDTIFAPSAEQQEALKKAEESISEEGEYSSMTEVAAYIHLYGRLPSNYISKTKAKDQGWIQSEGNLQEVLPGKSIGGSRFYNDEGVLPEKDGRKYTECDIDYKGGKRNAKRIVFSDDGLVFYTEDHYETYIQLY